MKTIYEVAELFGVHYNTIRNWIKAGTLHAFKVGSTIRISEDELERFIRDGESK